RPWENNLPRCLADTVIGQEGPAATLRERASKPVARRARMLPGSPIARAWSEHGSRPSPTRRGRRPRRDQNRDRIGEHDPLPLPSRPQPEPVIVARGDEHPPELPRVPRLGERPLEQPLQLRLELVERRARRRKADLAEERS